jgi:hypothetical protein
MDRLRRGDDQSYDDDAEEVDGSMMGPGLQPELPLMPKMSEKSIQEANRYDSMFYAGKRCDLGKRWDEKEVLLMLEAVKRVRPHGAVGWSKVRVILSKNVGIPLEEYRPSRKIEEKFRNAWKYWKKKGNEKGKEETLGVPSLDSEGPPHVSSDTPLTGLGARKEELLHEIEKDRLSTPQENGESEQQSGLRRRHGDEMGGRLEFGDDESFRDELLRMLRNMNGSIQELLMLVRGGNYPGGIHTTHAASHATDLMQQRFMLPRDDK